MMKKVLPVAVAALVLSVGGSFAEPPMSVTEGNILGVDNHRPEKLTDTDMVSVTGRGACTALGKFVVVVGLIGLSHQMVATGQAMIGLAPFVCA